jgi:uncharacterized protein
MVGILINCAAIIIGSLIGVLLTKKMSTEMEETITVGSGFVVLVIGIQMAFKYENVVYLALSIILGGIVGTAIDLDSKVLYLGKAIERLVYHHNPKEKELSVKKQNSKNFPLAFLNASVLFCTGAMAILGSLKAGIEKDYSILITKSILDGFIAISFATAMGIGTAFSSIAIFLYEGAITLLSSLLKPFCTQVMLNELTGSGGCLIIMIAINFIGLKKIKTANYLFAMIFTIIFVLLDPYLKGIIKF